MGAHLPEAVSETRVPGPSALRVPDPGRVRIRGDDREALTRPGSARRHPDRAGDERLADRQGRQETTDKALEVLRRRIDALGVTRSTESLGPVVDTAIVNVLPRTINTGISTLFILAALLFLGGDSLADFALALLLGILVGTYWSNLTAAPLLVELEKRFPAPPTRPKVKQRDRDAEPDRGAVV
ncbi:hypothetical protein [Kribbella qitaiheensis]|uniref:hypothetical protein n=1 Tax=Kribbella qitaiheensis TaxID=1544730 RepID=UPI001FE37413|nr:hypothetical protein [Kribbella qitaiheensis]